MTIMLTKGEEGHLLRAVLYFCVSGLHRTMSFVEDRITCPICDGATIKVSDTYVDAYEGPAMVEEETE